MRPIRLLALALLVSLGIAACGDDGDPPAVENADVFAEAVDATQSADSANLRISFDYSLGFATPTEPLEAIGSLDFPTGDFGVAVDLAGTGLEGVLGVLGANVELRLIDGDMYLFAPRIAEISDDSREWLRLEDFGDGGLGSLIGFDLDPTELLNLVNDVGSIEEVGTVEFDGATVTQYEGQVPYSELYDRLPSAISREMPDRTETPLPVEVLVDEADRVVRLALDAAFAEVLGDATDERTMTVSMEFTDFGAGAPIVVPNDDQIRSFAEVAASLFGDS